jgi:MFS family permease
VSPTGQAAGRQWQDEPRVVSVQRRTVRILIASQIVGGVGVGAAASMGSLLAESVTHSEALAGLARTSSTLGAAVFGLPLALLATKKGRRGALSLGWALAALGGVVLVLSAVQGSVVLLVLGMLMFGSGSATNLQSRYAAADLASPLHRARTLSVVIWSTTIGAVVGPNLAAPGAAVSRGLGLPRLAGAFVISAVVLSVAAIALWAVLRPDPLLEARRYEAEAARNAGLGKAPDTGMREVFRLILSTPTARFAFVAIVLGHTIMGAVMTMTPVDMNMMGHSLTLVGITISAHVLGMYAFSPVVGWLADRFGRLPIIMVGQAIFLCAAVCAGLAGRSVVLITAGLFLLGLGWSFALVSGSAMLSESVDSNVRPAVQGTADTAMNIVSALAAGLSGPILAGAGFGGLNSCAALLVLPVLFLAPSVRRGTVARGATEPDRNPAEPAVVSGDAPITVPGSSDATTQ